MTPRYEMLQVRNAEDLYDSEIIEIYNNIRNLIAN